MPKNSVSTIKTFARYLLAIFFFASGVNHFLSPVFYLQSMPPYLPLHEPIIYLTGFFAIVLGILLLLPRSSTLAAWGMIVWLIAVFPANVHMAFNSHLYNGVSAAALWLRLPLQFLFILWAYWFTKPNRKVMPETGN